jgi:small subunit ribosomal protein S4
MQIRLKALKFLGENIWASPKIKRSIKEKWFYLKKQKPSLYPLTSVDKRTHLLYLSSLYKLRLKNKQRVKKFYGNIGEGTFKKLYTIKDLSTFIGSLESRLDTLLYRLHFAATPFMARQRIYHKHFKVNNRPVKRKSLTLNVNDLISVNGSKAYKSLNADLRARTSAVTRPLVPVPSYLEVDYRTLAAILCAKPTINQVSYPFQASLTLLTEFYKK